MIIQYSIEAWAISSFLVEHFKSLSLKVSTFNIKIVIWATLKTSTMNFCSKRRQTIYHLFIEINYYIFFFLYINADGNGPHAYFQLSPWRSAGFLFLRCINILSDCLTYQSDKVKTWNACFKVTSPQLSIRHHVDCKYS